MSLKIMVADDEPQSLKAIRALTVPSGHTVVTFEDPKEAAERAEERRFDAVFVGMRLPELAGLELVRQVRNSPTNRHTAIIMLNASDDIESLRKAFAEGADFVLTKPIIAARFLPLLAAMESPGWNGKRHAARMPLFTEVSCRRGERADVMRTLNISESGVLLQSAATFEVGEEVSLQFDIVEVQASLSVLARIVRKEAPDRVGAAFVDLAPEAINAIHLFVMGRLPKAPRSSGSGEQHSNWLSRGFPGQS
jgi:CheY-like chemotaxis protein